MTLGWSCLKCRGGHPFCGSEFRSTCADGGLDSAAPLTYASMDFEADPHPPVLGPPYGLSISHEAIPATRYSFVYNYPYVVTLL